MSLSSLASRYDLLLCDLDGTVWVGDEPTPGAVEALEAWRAAGKAIAFVTNETRLTELEFVRKLWGIGAQASVEEVVTAGGALQHHLAEHPEWHSAYVIGSDAVYRNVEGAGKRIVNHTTFDERADVVVLAIHDGFDHDELRTAIRCALRGAPVIAATRDANFPLADGPSPGTGTIVAAVEAGAGVTATSVGKPEPGLFLTALDRMSGADPVRALVVGDRLDTDIAGAHAAGLPGVLVLTGSEDAAPSKDVPGLITTRDSLAALLLA